MEKTIKRLGEENSAGKRCIVEMKQRKKGNIWCYVCAMCIFLFTFSYSVQICKLGLTKERICHNFIMCNDIMLTFVLTYFKPMGKRQVD